jgi:hypothetical protein
MIVIVRFAIVRCYGFRPRATGRRSWRGWHAAVAVV